MFSSLFGGSKATNKKKGRKTKGENLKAMDENKLTEIEFDSHTIKGTGTKKLENQDTFAIVDNVERGWYFFAVLDGHGSSGREASTAACDNFQQYLMEKSHKIDKLVANKDRESLLKAAFKHTEKKLTKSGIDYSNSGTCCIAVFIHGNMCSISNLGDSRAVLCRWVKNKRAIELSWDHKPTRSEERERIEKKGGKIEKLFYNGEHFGPYRVWADEEGPGIAMTRTLGDLKGKEIGLISEPEIQHIELKPGDKFIVIASDGVWDVMSSAEVVGFILHQHGKDIKGIGEALATEARSRWEELTKSKKISNKVGDYPTAKKGIDDITCVIAFLKFRSAPEVDLSEGLAGGED